MGQNELFVLRRAGDAFLVLGALQRAIHQRHCHRLAFGPAKHQTIAAGEMRRLVKRIDKTVNHLAFG
ncbi:hypothetical protein D3C80_596460 [compost metagenome]